MVALTENFAIGKDNDLVCRSKTDLANFKALTTGHSVIMGRKTWESLPGLLPNRKNIIITRNDKYDIAGAVAVPSLSGALMRVEGRTFIIGGGEIYREALPMASVLHITQFHKVVSDADTFFPELNFNEWRLETMKETAECSFLTFTRIETPSCYSPSLPSLQA